jgi:hypothetical protein
MNFEDYSSLSDYAKKIGANPTNLKNWVEKSEITPAGKFGNMNVYLISDLVKAVGNNASSAAALRAVGYIHPDQHAEVVERAQRLAVENAEKLAVINGYSDLLDRADAEYAELLANYNGLQAELEATRKKLAALDEAGVDNWDGYGHAMDILHGEDDSE